MVFTNNLRYGDVRFLDATRFSYKFRVKTKKRSKKRAVSFKEKMNACAFL